MADKVWTLNDRATTWTIKDRDIDWSLLTRAAYIGISWVLNDEFFDTLAAGAYAW